MPSKREIEQSLGKALVQLAASSFEFAAILRGIFPQFVIQPVQAIDSGQIRPRAKLTFLPAAILEGSGVNCEGHGNDNLSVTLDLFQPPVHIAQLRRCLAARETHPGLSFKGIAAMLGISHMTVKRAFNYARLMQKAGASEPYREVRWAAKRRLAMATASSAALGSPFQGGGPLLQPREFLKDLRHTM